MKKLLLLSAVLLGAASVSHAGVRFNLNLGVPAPVVVVPTAPAYVQPCAPAYQDPSCAPTYAQPAPAYVQPYCAPAPVVVAPPVIDFRFHRDYHPYYGRHDRDDWRERHHDRR